MDRYQPGTLRMPAARSQGFEEVMALIEIPNAYTFDMAISATDPKRFAVIGEPVVAVDLINTVAAPGVCGNRVRVARYYRRAGGS